MKLDLPKEVISGLPAPDSKGLVRATVALKIGDDGSSVELVEINDEPVPSDPKEESSEIQTDDENPMPKAPEIPSADQMY